MNVLIIEDEPPAADRLAALLRQYAPPLIILDPLDTVEDEVEWIAPKAPSDLLLMDIHLADGSSFEIFEQVEVKSPVIFTTAYDQYALQAFKTNSVDYLLKPVKYVELEAALDKYKKLFRQSTLYKPAINMQELANMLRQPNLSYKSRFLVKAGKLIKTVMVSEVAYFHFEDRLTWLVTKDERRYPVKNTLDELEGLLDPDQFTRANRSFIVGIEAIQKIHPWFKGRLKLDLQPPQEGDLVISAEKTKRFKEWLDNG